MSGQDSAETFGPEIRVLARQLSEIELQDAAWTRMLVAVHDPDLVVDSRIVVMPPMYASLGPKLAKAFAATAREVLERDGVAPEKVAALKLAAHYVTAQSLSLGESSVAVQIGFLYNKAYAEFGGEVVSSMLRAFNQRPSTFRDEVGRTRPIVIDAVHTNKVFES